MQGQLRFIFATALLGLGVASAQAATLVASYSFNDTLAANQAGKPSLVSVDPLGLNSFETAVVNGASQRVFHWNGSGATPTNNAGLRNAEELSDKAFHILAVGDSQTFGPFLANEDTWPAWTES